MTVASFKCYDSPCPTFSTRRDCGQDYLELAPRFIRDDSRDVARLRPSWRWDEAVIYSNASGNMPTHTFNRLDDRFVSQIYPYVCYINNAGPRNRPIAFTDAKRKWPGLTSAHRIYESTDMLRHYIEAMILSNNPPENIAEALHINEDAVWWYEKAFFDIRPYLDVRHSMRIEISAIWPALQLSMEHRRMAFEWKLVGWALGMTQLNRLAGICGTYDADTLAVLRRATDKRIVTDALFATHARMVNQFNAEEVIMHYHKLRELESSIEAPQPANEQYSTALLELMNKSMSRNGASDSLDEETANKSRTVFEGRAGTTAELPERYRGATVSTED